MIQEYKELLKDLCERLPYRIKVKTPYNDASLVGIIKRDGYSKETEYVDVITDKQTYPIRYIKPYLRPMSSMTEEEYKEYSKLWDLQDKFPTDADIRFKIDVFDWLNANHFDYRRLIEKGLAIEVTKENNPYERK